MELQEFIKRYTPQKKYTDFIIDALASKSGEEYYAILCDEWKYAMNNPTIIKDVVYDAMVSYATDVFYAGVRQNLSTPEEYVAMLCRRFDCEEVSVLTVAQWGMLTGNITWHYFEGDVNFPIGTSVFIQFVQEYHSQFGGWTYSELCDRYGLDPVDIKTNYPFVFDKAYSDVEYLKQSSKDSAPDVFKEYLRKLQPIEDKAVYNKSTVASLLDAYDIPVERVCEYTGIPVSTMKMYVKSPILCPQRNMRKLYKAFDVLCDGEFDATKYMESRLKDSSIFSASDLQHCKSPCVCEELIRKVVK